MNKDNAQDYLPLVQALADGKTLQFLNSNAQWEDCTCPSFNQMPVYYRIKPEPKKQSYRVALLKTQAGNFYTVTIDSENQEKDFEKTWRFVCWLTDFIEYELPEGDA